MTASETDLCRRLEDYRRNPLGAIAMNTTAPTIRAQELEIQRLKAGLGEAVEVLQQMAEEWVDYMTINHLGDPWAKHNMKRARGVLLKHGRLS